MADKVVEVALRGWIVVSWNEVATLWYSDKSEVVEVLPVATDSSFGAFVVSVDSSFLGPEGRVFMDFLNL